MKITTEGLRRIVHEIIVQKLEEREKQKLTEAYSDTPEEEKLEAEPIDELKVTLRSTLHAMIEEFGEDAARVELDDAWEDAMVEVSHEDPAEEAEDERNRGARG
jgi:hypothetical protein